MSKKWEWRLRFFLERGAQTFLTEDGEHGCTAAPCHWCGWWLHVRALTVDHVVPRVAGGGQLGRDNVVPACAECNTQRDREWHASPEGLAYDSQLRVQQKAEAAAARRTTWPKGWAPNLAKVSPPKRGSGRWQNGYWAAVRPPCACWPLCRRGKGA